MPVSSIVGSIALTSTSESTPVATAVTASTISAARSDQRAPPSCLRRLRLRERVDEVGDVDDQHQMIAAP